MVLVNGKAKKEERIKVYMRKKMSRRKKNRYLAVLMAMIMIVTTVIVYPSSTLATGNNAVKFEVGMANLPVTLTYDKKVEDGKTNEAGRYDSTMLYQYLLDLGWNDTSVPPEITSVEVNYEINYPKATSAEDRAALGGNPMYKGSIGKTVISYDPANPQAWKEKIIAAERPEKEVTTTAKVMLIPDGKTQEEAKPISDVKVKIKDTQIEKVTDTKGEVVFYGYSKENTPEAELVVEATYTYPAANIKLKDFSGTIYLKERPKVTEDDYIIESAVNGFVKKPEADTTYTVKAKNGAKLTLTRDGSPSDEVSVTLSAADNKTTPFFVYKNGICSDAVMNVLKVDSTAPAISDIQTKAAKKEVVIKEHGIYTKVKADLLITLTVEDTESGVGDINLIGSNAEGKTVYKTTKVTKKDNRITATFVIESQKEMMKQTLYLTATDKVGNKGDEILLRGNPDASDLTLEIIPPIVSDIKVTNTKKNENGWYKEALEFEVEAKDAESGIAEITAMVEDKVLYSKSYDNKVLSTEKATFNLTEEQINEIKSKTGDYKIIVKVTDNCGNISTKDLNVKVDIQPPTMNLTGVGEGAYVQNAPEIKITEYENYIEAEGNRFTVLVKRNGKNVYDKTFEKQFDTVLPKNIFEADGEYQIITNATDAAGNKAKEIVKNFVKDGTKPEVGDFKVTNAKQNENGWFNEPLELTVETKDYCAGLKNVNIKLGNNVLYKKDYEKNESDSDNAKFNLTKRLIESEKNSTGEYTFVLTATDYAGNEIVKSATVKVDIVTPVLFMNGFTEGSFLNKEPSVVITEEENYVHVAGNKIDVSITRNGDKVFSEEYNKVAQVKIPENVFAEDGKYVITANATDAAGNKANEISGSFTKDKTAPIVEIKGPQEGKYLNTSQNVTVTVKELNYKTDEVFIEATRTLGGKTEKLNFPWSNKGETSSSSMTAHATGTYKFSVYAVDEAGNKSKTETLSFTVDTESPTVVIDGVSDGGTYSYNDNVAPIITCTDDYLEGKEISLTRAGQNWLGNLDKTDDGERISFANFSRYKENDGVYILKVTVRDKAGNETTKEISFIVNRFGSSFEFNEVAKKINGKAVKEIKEDIVITETNVTKLVESKNALRCDGKNLYSQHSQYDNKKTKEIERSNGNYIYEHRYTPDEMKDEGVYEINVTSKDSAGNIVESKEKAGPLKFTIDRTPPSLRVKGALKMVHDKSHTIQVDAVDALSSPKVKVYVNDKKIDPTKMGEDYYEFTLGEGTNQRYKIVATDDAGNKGVYEKKISIISNDILYYLFQYKYAIALAIVLGTLYIWNEVRAIRKEREEEALAALGDNDAKEK